MIKADILESSLVKAQEILNESSNLKAVEATVDYRQRDPYFTNLLGETGHMTFNPEVSLNILDPFKEMLMKGVGELRDRYYGENHSSEKANLYRSLYYLADRLYDNLITDNLLSNTVPKEVTRYIKEVTEHKYYEDNVRKAFRDFQSPKLSKMFVKLWGEQHDIVKWFTTKCPKKLTKGVNEEWEVTVSILPHHIAGMSYYGSLNHGGKRWMEGYEGTSCMDTKRNSRGSGIFALIPSLRDEVMAVAYLSKKEHNDIWNPVYEVRSLLRVCYVNGEPFVIACRPYYTSNEATHIMIDGLKNKFGNVHFVRDIRNYNDGDQLILNKTYSSDVTLHFDNDVKCPHCEGNYKLGRDEYGYTQYCEHCCEGEIECEGDHRPYIDDDDLMDVYGEYVQFTIPYAYLDKVGIKVDPEMSLPEGWTVDGLPKEPELVEAEVVEPVREVRGIRAAQMIHDEVVIDLETNDDGGLVIPDYSQMFGWNHAMPVRQFGDEVTLNLQDAEISLPALRQLLGLDTPPQPYVRFIDRDEEVPMYHTLERAGV